MKTDEDLEKLAKERKSFDVLLETLEKNDAKFLELKTASDLDRVQTLQEMRRQRQLRAMAIKKKQLGAKIHFGLASYEALMELDRSKWPSIVARSNFCIKTMVYTSISPILFAEEKEIQEESDTYFRKFSNCAELQQTQRQKVAILIQLGDERTREEQKKVQRQKVAKLIELGDERTREEQKMAKTPSQLKFEAKFKKSLQFKQQLIDKIARQNK